MNEEKNKFTFRSCLSVFCLASLVVLCGCSGSMSRKPTLLFTEHPDGSWDVDADGVSLETFIREWAAEAKVELSDIPPETRRSTVNSTIRDVDFRVGLEAVLEHKGYMLFEREGILKVMSLVDYKALPPVTREYAITSSNVSHAMGLVMKFMNEQGLKAEPDLAAAKITFAGTWEEQDQVRQIVTDFGSAEPLPVRPDAAWPDKLPERFAWEAAIGTTEKVQELLQTQTVEIQHVSAEKLEQKLNQLVPFSANEFARFAHVANVLMVTLPPGKMDKVLEIIAYLDDPVWHVVE